MRNHIFLCFLVFSFPSVSYGIDPIVIGKWYDDLGSPSFLDAVIIIEREGDRYFINRRNGDGSGGRYKLKKIGNSYLKVGDRFGAKYVVSEQGLELHDKLGFIRLARPIVE